MTTTTTVKATKTTVATTTTKTVKKTLSLKAQAAKRAQVKRNRKAGSKKASLIAKKKGIGLFAPVNLSKPLAAICGGSKMPRTMVTKKLWAYIKAKKLNEGRIIKPDGMQLTMLMNRSSWPPQDDEAMNFSSTCW